MHEREHLQVLKGVLRCGRLGCGLSNRHTAWRIAFYLMNEIRHVRRVVEQSYKGDDVATSTNVEVVL